MDTWGRHRAEPTDDQEIPNRSGVPGFSEVVIGEYGGDFFLLTKLQTSP
jgi:hypothetical protein